MIKLFLIEAIFFIKYKVNSVKKINLEDFERMSMKYSNKKFKKD
jgi:hypothetical protein